MLWQVLQALGPINPPASSLSADGVMDPAYLEQVVYYRQCSVQDV